MAARRVNVAASGGTLQFANITRNAGATVNFTGSGSTKFTNLVSQTNAILPYALVNGTDLPRALAPPQR